MEREDQADLGRKVPAVRLAAADRILADAGRGARAPYQSRSRLVDVARDIFIVSLALISRTSTCRRGLTFQVVQALVTDLCD